MVQRKIGPGQYVAAGASDPVYVIGDLSTVWMTAFVRERCANVAVGQDVTFNVLALPGRSLSARINYVATAIDPATRRLLVRATIDNERHAEAGDVRQRHDLFGQRPSGVGVPKQALICEAIRSGSGSRMRTRRLNCVRSSPASPGDLVEVVGNLRPGEQIVTRVRCSSTAPRRQLTSSKAPV